MSYGSILGDIAGSTLERDEHKDTRAPLFPPFSNWTDDTVLTLATAQALMSGTDFGAAYLSFGRQYRHPPIGGYGKSFKQWLRVGDLKPYGSYGNGSAMRVAPIGWFHETATAVLDAAERSAVCTHDHPEGVKGAQAVALAVFLARSGADKTVIRKTLTEKFGYDLTRTCDDIRPGYHFDVTCKGSVPEALTAFLDSENFEDALRLAVSLGGDADTLACIAGAIAEAFYGKIPPARITYARALLPDPLRQIADTFHERYVLPRLPH